jgi:hypothetical protein
MMLIFFTIQTSTSFRFDLLRYLPSDSFFSHLDGLGLGQACYHESSRYISIEVGQTELRVIVRRLTLDVSQSLLQKLLLESGLGELSLDTGSDGLDEIELLRLSLLLFVTNPRIEDLLELSLDGVLLLELEVLVLELGDLLGDGVQVLGDRDDLLQLLDRVDPLRYGLGVLLPGSLEDAGDSVDVTVRPGSVRGTDGSSGSSDDDEESDGEDGLFVGDLNECTEG